MENSTIIDPIESEDDTDEYHPSGYEQSYPRNIAMGDSEGHHVGKSSDDGDDHSEPTEPSRPFDKNGEKDYQRAQYSKKNSHGLTMCELIPCNIEHTISNPSIWAAAVQEISSLKPNIYVAGSIMNLFLLTAWFKTINHTYCHFVDLFMTSTSLPPEPEEIAQFRVSSGLYSNPQVSPPQKPVVFIICRHQHYFTVCFDYQLNHAWVFGRSLDPSKAGLHPNAGWNEWDGLMYWRRVVKLFGWPVSSVNPRVNEYNFEQVVILSL